MSRHVTAQDRAAQFRVTQFVKAWKRHFTPTGVDIISGVEGARLWLSDLEALTAPRQVIRTIEQLQALDIGVMLKVQGDRAAQIETLDWDVDSNGEIILGKRIVYAGTDLFDYLLPDPLDKETLDTLRRMLPAIVIDPVE